MKDYTPRVFTRDDPCTKVDMHNCFYSGGVYVNRPVIEAHTIIGVNSPKYLIDKGFATVRMIRGVDHYCLTPAGDAWLRKGILRYLTLHPDKAAECKELPIGYTRQAPRKSVQPSPNKTVLRRTRAC